MGRLRARWWQSKGDARPFVTFQSSSVVPILAQPSSLCRDVGQYFPVPQRKARQPQLPGGLVEWACP